MPDIPRIIYVPSDVAGQWDFGRAFTEIRVLEVWSHAHRPRFEAMLSSEFEQTLFIDDDTIFLDSVYELFELLTHFDLGIAVAPQHFHFLARKQGIYALLPPVSAAIPEWNSGVIVANTHSRFRTMVRQWAELLTITSRNDYQMDQPALRSALTHSDLRIATIPSNYNFRAMVLQSVLGKVKIMHGRGKLDEIGNQLNQTTKQRIYKPHPDQTGIAKPGVS